MKTAAAASSPDVGIGQCAAARRGGRHRLGDCRYSSNRHRNHRLFSPSLLFHRLGRDCRGRHGDPRPLTPSPHTPPPAVTGCQKGHPMSIIITADGNTRHLDEELELLRHLVADLERIRHGGAPTRRELAEAPFLDDWSLGMRFQLCLTGTVHGHPSIARGHRSVTSHLHLFAPHHGYARTMSRFYRLGEPADGEEESDQQR